MFLPDTAIFDSSTWCNRLARVGYPGSASPFEKFSLDRSVKTWRFFYARASLERIKKPPMGAVWLFRVAKALVVAGFWFGDHIRIGEVPFGQHFSQSIDTQPLQG